jgi:hypothetical protein
LSSATTHQPFKSAARHQSRGKSAVDAAILRRLMDASLCFAAFLGGFVLFEPAPYEVFVAGLMGIFLLLGLPISLSTMPLLLLMTTFSIGGVITMFQLENPSASYVYIAVTFFLGLTAWFFSLMVLQDPYRLKIIMWGYIIGAIGTALLGILGYFSLLPGSELFLRFGRAKGAFQDPNVLAPFLVLPAVWLFHGILTRSANLLLLRAAGLGILLIGILLAFSRGGWGLILFSLAAVYLLVFIQNNRAQERLKLILMAIAGLIAMLLAMAVALQFEAVSSVFSTRAQLVQEYDGGELGRFQRHGLGFMLALEKPWGIGRSEFAKLFTEDPHNIWLKTLMVYGWLGFASFVAITFLTIKRGFGLLFLNRPWTPYLQVLYVVFIGHIIMAYVIDIDHWRHVFLIFGLLWGIYGLEHRHQTQKSAHRATA